MNKGVLIFGAVALVMLLVYILPYMVKKSSEPQKLFVANQKNLYERKQRQKGVNIQASRDIYMVTDFKQKARDLSVLKHRIRLVGQNKTCPAHFNTTAEESINHLLRIKTDKETERYLRGLGFTRRTSSIEDLKLPNYVKKKVTAKLPVIVTAASSNHFGELQALFYHIMHDITIYFPKIKIIVYDLGLTRKERSHIIKFGRSELRTFQFDKYPEHIKNLHLCAWKPIIIQEVIQVHGFVFYMDTSLRPKGEQLQKYFDKSITTGHVFRSQLIEQNAIPFHTLPETFDYFHTLACLFHGIPEMGAGLILIRSDNVASYVIMRTYVACALQKNCITPLKPFQKYKCVTEYHSCHRFDQSALSITLILLYHSLNNVPLFDVQSFDVRRGEKCDFIVQTNEKRPITKPIPVSERRKQLKRPKT